MKVEVTVCNTCKVPGKPTHVYTITLGSRSVEVDLCDEHSDQLDEWLGQEPSFDGAYDRALARAEMPRQEPRAPRTATKKAVAKRATSAPKSATGGGSGRRSRGVKVTTLKDIEASKGGTNE